MRDDEEREDGGDDDDDEDAIVVVEWVEDDDAECGGDEVEKVGVGGVSDDFGADSWEGDSVG